MRTYPLLLIGNGAAVPRALLRKLAKEANCILAVDGGANYALQAAVWPNALIGDLDSASADAQKYLRARTFHISWQENTDLEKALHWAVEHQFPGVTLVDFIGKRWDFSIGNLLTCAKWADKLDIRLIGQRRVVYPLVSGGVFKCRPDKRVSIIPLETCTNVTLKGFKYPLNRARLELGTTRSLSNQTTGNEFEVKFTRGRMLVYQEF